MIIEETKKYILSNLSGFYPEKVIEEVMDEYFYITIDGLKSKIKNKNSLIDVFLNEILSLYKTDDCIVVSDMLFGEIFELNYFNAGMHTGFLISANCKNKNIEKIMKEACGLVFKNGIYFINEIDFKKASNAMIKILISNYKRILAPHIVVLSRSVVEYTDVYEVAALKGTENDVFDTIDEEEIIYNVDPEMFANGDYDYLFNAGRMSMCF